MFFFRTALSKNPQLSPDLKNCGMNSPLSKLLFSWNNFLLCMFLQFGRRASSMTCILDNPFKVADRESTFLSILIILYSIHPTFVLFLCSHLVTSTYYLRGWNVLPVMLFVLCWLSLGTVLYVFINIKMVWKARMFIVK